MNHPLNSLIEEILAPVPNVFNLLFIKDGSNLRLKDTPQMLIKNSSFLSSGESTLRNLALNLYNGQTQCSVADLKGLDLVLQQKVFSALLNSIETSC